MVGPIEFDAVLLIGTRMLAATFQVTGECPFLPSSFLQTGRSSKPRFSEFECYKAACDDFTHPATTSHCHHSSNAASHALLGHDF